MKEGIRSKLVKEGSIKDPDQRLPGESIKKTTRVIWRTFFYIETGYKRFFDQREIKKMSLLVQRSVVESFSFRGINVRSVHVPTQGECLVGIDVSRAFGYADDNNGRRQLKGMYPKYIRSSLKTLKAL